MDILIDSSYLLVAGGIALVLVVMVYFLSEFYLKVKKQAPSILVFRKAYKEHKPVVEVIDGAGNLHHFVGEKDKKYDVDYKKKDWGIKIDSIYSTISPEERLPNGVPILRYGINFHFPTDSRGLHSLIALLRYIRSEYDQFDIFSDDMVLIELCDMDSDELENSIKLKLKDFDPDYNEDDEVRVAEMVYAIERIKAELPRLNIRSEPLSITSGMKLIPNAFTAQDYNKGLQLKEYQVKQEGQFETKIMTYTVACVMILGAVGLIIYIMETVA